MSDPLAIQGNYADFKLVKTRSVAQIIVEVPIERAEQVVKMLGLPVPAKEIPVVVARWKPALNKVQDRPTTARKPAATERTRSQWAGIRCNDPTWRQWFFRGRELTPDEAAGMLRRKLSIQSRKELDSNPAKAAAWDKLDASFMQDTGRMAEKHG